MSNQSINIDRVVREVLAELGKAPAEAEAAPAAAEVASNGELSVSCQVVTLAEVEGRLDSVRRLVVPPRAVVTPAVRDELLQRNVKLEYARSAKPQAARLVIMTVGKSFDPSPLAKEAIEIEQRSDECIIAAVDHLAAEVVKPNTLGLLLTGHVAAGLCLANRHDGVRAVCRTSVVAQVGANLLIIDPTAHSTFRLKQIVAEFCRGGKRSCPEVFRSQLG